MVMKFLNNKEPGGAGFSHARKQMGSRARNIYILKQILACKLLHNRVHNNLWSDDIGKEVTYERKS